MVVAWWAVIASVNSDGSYILLPLALIEYGLSIIFIIFTCFFRLFEALFYLSFKLAQLTAERTALIAPIFHALLTVRAERYDFTFAYEHAYGSFVLAKPDLEPRWKSLYYPLANEVWMAVVAPFILVPFILSLVVFFYHTP